MYISFLTGTTLKEPERQAIGEDASGQSNRKKISLYKVLTQPRIIMLAIAASVRHCGGMTFAYNADLYYIKYFPDVDLAWWLFAVTIGIGSIGMYFFFSLIKIKNIEMIDFTIFKFMKFNFLSKASWWAA